MALQFKERTSGAEGSARFSLEMSEAEYTYVLDDDAGAAVTPQQVQAQIETLLGTTDTTVRQGGLARTLPAVHPMYPNCYAEEVAIRPPSEELHEVGAAQSFLEAPQVDGFAAYTGYEFAVKFRHRGGVSILSDKRIKTEKRTWYDRSGQKVVYKAYPEWLRYTLVDPDADFSPKLIEAQQAGGMVFRAPGVTGVDGTPFTGTPTIPLNDIKLSVTWYQVPHRYYTSTNSHWRKYVNRVNQIAWWDYAKAELLYVGAKILKTYKAPQFRAEGVPTRNNPGTFNTDRLCDVALMFILTQRTPGKVIDDDLIDNKNWVPYGHNLLPHFHTRKFYYGTTRDQGETLANPFPSTWRPSYDSFDAALLFQDPDAVNIEVLGAGPPSIGDQPE